MVNVIVIQNGASAEQMGNAMATVPADLRSGLITIGAQALPHGTHINSQKFSMPSCIEMAAEKSTSDTLMLIDARVTPSTEVLQSMVSQMSDKNIGFLFAPIEHGSDMLNIPETSADALLSIISSEAPLPLACCAFRKSLIKGNLEGASIADILSSLLVTAMTDDMEVTSSHTAIGQGQSIDAGRFIIGRSAQARCLRLLVNNSNIEEIFPHHAWAAHRDESAAASYHTLAAMFLRYGDANSALECLGLGDRFEDSPRSLALKGLIALERGETLTAVANMVSSLQQYESRKKENNSHYVHFAPGDLDSISSNLNAGLEALHRKNNEEALGHFAKAVFNFDPFYSQLGVTQIRAGGISQ
jgi:hypothetical protein